MRLSVLPFASVLLAACGPSVTDSQLTGPRCDSTFWMHVLVVSAPAPTDPPDFHFTGQCMQRTPTIEASGPTCVVVEARHTGGACACDPAAARAPIAAAHVNALDTIKETEQAASLDVDCFCEIPLLQGPERDACANDAADAPAIDGQPVDGVCYVDATLTPPIGNPELTANCPSTERRLMRFVGKGAPSPSVGESPSAVFVLCEQGTCASP